MRCRELALSVVAGGLLLPPPGQAQREQDATLSACVSQVVSAARAEAAKPYGAPVVDFLLGGEHRAFDYQLPHDGCYGFAAVGHRQVQHLGLTLYAPSGRVLGRDRNREAYAYARFCGEAGRRFVVEVRMLDGEGEFHLVPLWNGPARLNSLAPAVSQCMDAGAARPGPVDVGPEPHGPPIDVQLLSVTRQLSAQGYRLESGILFGGLPEHRREARRVMLAAGHCYALAAVGDSAVADIDLRLLSLREGLSVVAMDVTRRRDAIVKVCPEDTGPYILDVRMYRGGGHYVVQSFGLIEGDDYTGAGIEGGTRIPYAETVARLDALGMSTETLTWGFVKPGEAQSVPLQLTEGECYAIAAIATPDFSSGDLDMSLVDERGGLAAAEHGANPHPLVFHCADRSAVYRAVLRSHGVRRPGRFVLLLGQDVREPAPMREVPL